MDDRTYIKIFRKMLDWEWYGDANTFRVFMHILLRANYKPSQFKGQTIGAGECVFGRRAWAEVLGLSEQQIRTAISHLQSTNEITTRATNQFTIIHVEKWDFWQVEEGQATNESTNENANEQPTSNQRATTSKESKKVRNTIPTIEDVRKYVADNNLVIDADYFYKYYSTAEWKDSKGKRVGNWKLKALNWNKREVDNGRANGFRTGNRERGRLREADGRSREGASPDSEGVRRNFIPMAQMSYEAE